MKNKLSKVLIVVFSLFVGLLHFLIGPDYQGLYREFIRSYLIDILLPMDLYLLLQISLRDYFKVKYSRIIGVSFSFLFGITVEVLQLNKIHFLGSTFDPVDILMYGFGISLGVLLDFIVIDKLERNIKSL